MKDTSSIFFLSLLMIISSCSSRSNPEEPLAISLRDSVSYYGEQAHNFYESGNMDKSRAMYLRMLEFDNPDSLKLADVILRKRLFFVPDTFQVPGGLIQKRFILKPLKAIHAELDYKAVKNSKDHLTGVIGRRDWPGDLTLEEDRNALAGHEWEFENRMGFVYTVMNKAESEVIGCVYIYPSRLDDFDSEVVLWVTKTEFEKGMDENLYDAVVCWLSREWPFGNIIYPGRELSWGAFFHRLGVQDEKYSQ